MKKSVSPIAVALTALSISGIGSLQGAIAQEQPAILQEQGATQPHRIRLRNVAPAFMAWWLDPAHNTEPLLYQVSRANAEGVLPVGPLEKDPTKPLGDYKLPAGIDKLVPLDAQNTLLVVGTGAGVAELEKVIAGLDKVLKQVQVEVHYLEISEDGVKKLGLKNFSRASEKDPVSWAILTPNSKPKVTQTSTQLGLANSSMVEEMVRKSKARLIAAPRVTAINNLTAALRSTTSRPFTLGPEGPDSGFPMYTEPDTESLLYWSSGLGITVRPSINNDRTINLALAPGVTLKLLVPPKASPKDAPLDLNSVKTVWQRQLGGIVNLTNIEDGQTVAIMGLKSDSLITRNPTDKSKPANMLVLVTPYIIRRADDAEN
jgi:type II secretory pathway component GspD/PulD (secretin)